MDKETILNDIFENDPLGILEVRPTQPIPTPDDRLRVSFEEINSFFEIYNKEPQKTTDMKERGLFSRLKGIKENPTKIEALKQYDRFNLLGDI